MYVNIYHAFSPSPLRRIIPACATDWPWRRLETAFIEHSAVAICLKVVKLYDLSDEERISHQTSCTALRFVWWGTNFSSGKSYSFTICLMRNPFLIRQIVQLYDLSNEERIPHQASRKIRTCTDFATCCRQIRWVKPELNSPAPGHTYSMN